MSDERLYNLLPAIYRLRDVERGEPLRALLAVLESEFLTIEADVRALYDNWFIETCDEWAVPYLADLLGIDGIAGDASLPYSQRSLVAHTIGYRQWKGTPATLEHAARDASGWPTAVIEFFDRLAMTQSIRYPRPGKGGTVDLRAVDHGGPVGSPFDATAHTVSLGVTNGAAGPSARLEQRHYNIPSLGLLVWRLQSYPVQRGTARQIQPGCLTFNPFGLDAPLFNRPRSQTATRQRTTEEHVPGPLRRRPLIDELQRRREGRAPRTAYFGERPVFEVFLDGAPVPSDQLMIADLATWRRPPSGAAGRPAPIAVDPVRGRLALPEGVSAESVEVSYSFGFSADLGGGPYPRAVFGGGDQETWRATVGVDQLAEAVDLPRFDSLTEAIAAWSASGRAGVIQIADNRTYQLDPPPGEAGRMIQFDGPRSLVIEAASERCPCVRGDLVVKSEHAGSRLILNGLWIDGTVSARGPAQIHVTHCTLRPTGYGSTARPSLEMAGDVAGSQVVIASSVVGPLRLSSDALGLRIEDSVVDGLGGTAIAGSGEECHGPMAVIERATVLGSTAVEALLLGADTLFTGPAEVRRQQTGLIRYSYVPEGSRTPRRYRCQPDLALGEVDAALQGAIRQRLRPTFTALSYGDPGYAQLSSVSPNGIRTGSAAGGEMGVFHRLHPPQREARLKAVIEEYSPYNLRPGLIYCT